MAQPTEPSLADDFAAFFRCWLDHHQVLLDRLLSLLVPCPSPPATAADSHLTAVINQVLHHHLRYFDEATKLAGEDIFLLFSAPWLSPLERMFLWVGGFKPTMVLQLIDPGELTVDQARDVEELRAETRRRERELGDAMAAVQESVAAPPMLRLLRWNGRGWIVDGEASELEAAIVELRAAMWAVFEQAEELRGATVRRLMEVLTPVQTALFLVAAAQFQLRLRRRGLPENSSR